MTYRTEFPDFAEADLPALPEGFDDTSWHNDSAPSFQNDALRVRVWIDYADPDRSEWPEDRKSGGMKRFGVHRLDDDLEFVSDEGDLWTDDWNEVLAFILGESFAGVLREWLTEDQFATMRARNASPDYQGENAPCASHDFCDANMAMLEAFQAMFAREPRYLDGTDAEGDWPPAAKADLDLWNAAWSGAKARHLTGEPPAAG